MITLFQTASGSWHVPSILMATSWLIGTLVAGGFMLANLRVNRDDRVRAFQKEQQATSKIAQLEDAARPKPLKDRVIAFLGRLDSRAVTAAKGGQREFRGTFTTAQLSELQSLCSEDSNGEFIRQVETGSIIIPGAGRTGGIMFTITDNLLKEGTTPPNPNDSGVSKR